MAGGKVIKLTETYTLGISENLKHMAEQLTNQDKKDLNEKIRIEIARAVHCAQFDPKAYLLDEGE